MPGEQVEFFPVVVTVPERGRPVGEPAAVRVARASEVAAGDLVIGYAPATRTAVSRPLWRMGYQQPFRAVPRPYKPGCGCCEGYPTPHGPLAVVLSAPDAEGVGDECESYAAAEPVLIIPGGGR
ncbi:hypothetical protein [Kitasatospora sp. NPDC086791]|uniref:hypothetical protein n=1 Tax=Kitasatospora sp. NPDC086791 TaxID=3155178 RepID=UPI00342F6B2E